MDAPAYARGSGDIDGLTYEIGAEWIYGDRDIDDSKQRIIEMTPRQKGRAACFRRLSELPRTVRT
jgi:hypothetical protein